MNDGHCIEMTSQGEVATLVLNRPETLNAMNTDMMTQLSQALQNVVEQREIRVVIITGAGKGFCSGADLNQPRQGQEENNEGEHAMRDVFNPAMQALYDCPVPTIARVNGVAAGGGMGLALACDICIASDQAFFIATFGPRLGIVPDLGSTWNLPRKVGRARALGISMLGGRITATQAESWGLIWKTVGHDNLDTEIHQTAQALARTSPEAMVRIRQSIDAASNNSYTEQLQLEYEHQAVLIPKNMTEGAKAFVEKREPRFDGRSDRQQD